ncbi:hypothetical protein [Nocardioides aquiterrae]|uniref:hypothetical protein n=1 Tax=Nocardioides aquiterrae TaxID=203799 RepID=UPI0031D021A8
MIGDNWAEVSGHGSRQLLVDMTGRPPVWLTRSRAWSTTPKSARDLAALAELRGYDVTVTGADPGERRW